jgi:large conductance mechanosensitive channel
MIKEFKEFISRGNVVDLAVAVVIGAAFTGVVLSFTNDVLMQIIAIFGDEPNFSAYSLTVRNSEIRWGAFLTALINFLIIAFAIFLVVKAVNKLQSMRKSPEEELEETEVELLTQIRDALVNR